MNVLTLDTNWKNHHVFHQLFYEILIKSGLFNIKLEEIQINKEVLKIPVTARRHRFGELTYFKVNDKLIGLNSWSETEYLEDIEKAGIFNTKVDLYINWEARQSFVDMVKTKVSPLLMFPAEWSFVEAFKWENTKKENIGFLTTGPSSYRNMGRVTWHDYAIVLGIKTINKKISQNKYIAELAKTKWGIIISKLNYKNNREYEFISNHMPLVLNYCPQYPFPFNPDEHFLYMVVLRTWIKY